MKLFSSEEDSWGKCLEKMLQYITHTDEEKKTSDNLVDPDIGLGTLWAESHTLHYRGRASTGMGTTPII